MHAVDHLPEMTAQNNVDPTNSWSHGLGEGVQNAGIEHYHWRQMQRGWRGHMPVPSAVPLLQASLLSSVSSALACMNDLMCKWGFRKHLTGTLHLSAVWILSLHDASQVQDWHVVCFWRWDLETSVSRSN